jgi:EAL domain-containing protein (putative c-di-GMP-specific phosphodiesterase class I)
MEMDERQQGFPGDGSPAGGQQGAAPTQAERETKGAGEAAAGAEASGAASDSSAARRILPEGLQALRRAVHALTEGGEARREEPPADKPAKRGAGAVLPSLRSAEDEISAALRHGEFVLFLQPQIALQTFSISGAEVLLRWQHPARGLILPGEFLPLAEATQQVGEIGRWVLKTVCENFAVWRRWMGDRSSIAVNVSPTELLDSRFLPTTLSTLGQHKIPDGGVELELVETAVLANPALAHETITCLRRNGIRMALDDFGVGYASLSSLRDYPFTKIKIDRSFIQNLSASDRSRTIVRSMIDLGRSLQLTVNAEGVETPEQLQFLYENGCDEVQGYLFGKPMPSARFREWTAGFLGSLPATAAALGGSGAPAPRNGPAPGGCKVIAFSRRHKGC